MAIITDIRQNRGMVELVAEGATFARVRKVHFDKCPVAVGDAPCGARASSSLPSTPCWLG